MEERAIVKRAVPAYSRRSSEAPSRDFSEHSDLEPFLMTAEELENQHLHYLRYRQRVHRKEWREKSI